MTKTQKRAHSEEWARFAVVLAQRPLARAETRRPLAFASAVSVIAAATPKPSTAARTAAMIRFIVNLPSGVSVRPARRMG